MAENLTNIATVVISVMALVVSVLSWRASASANVAATFDRRYEIYADAEKFIGAWVQRGRPDLSLLPILVGAWTRSHFLCRNEVTSFLRKLWVDAVKADYLRQIMSGEADGDRNTAMQEFHALTREHTDFEPLKNAMLADLRVASEWRWKSDPRFPTSQ